MVDDAGRLAGTGRHGRTDGGMPGPRGPTRRRGRPPGGLAVGGGRRRGRGARPGGAEMNWPDDPALAAVVERVGHAVVLPRMRLVERAGAPSTVDDVGGTVRAEVVRVLGGATGDGAPVAVGVGSRGIAHLAEIVTATVESLRDAGFAPFVVPAMGSHGGGTPEGQIAVLARYGITEATLRVPVRATMETVVVGEAAGTPVHLDRHVVE